MVMGIMKIITTVILMAIAIVIVKTDSSSRQRGSSRTTTTSRKVPCPVAHSTSHLLSSGPSARWQAFGLEYNGTSTNSHLIARRAILVSAFLQAIREKEGSRRSSRDAFAKRERERGE